MEAEVLAQELLSSYFWISKSNRWLFANPFYAETSCAKNNQVVSETKL